MQKTSVVYTAVNLKHLEVTTDKQRYEELKAQGKIGVLFEPSILDNSFEVPIYIVGLIKEDEDLLQTPKQE